MHGSGVQAAGMLAHTSCCSRFRTSGRSARQCSVHVRTAAVVSCPAMSMVMRSSRSCLLVICRNIMEDRQVDLTNVRFS